MTLLSAKLMVPSGRTIKDIKGHPCL